MSASSSCMTWPTASLRFPGGLGTLEELAEVTTWSQLGLHAKPVVLLDVDGFWNPLVAQLDRMVAVGLLKPSNRALIQRAGVARGSHGGTRRRPGRLARRSGSRPARGRCGQ